jgi:hypothetical protein
VLQRVLPVLLPLLLLQRLYLLDIKVKPVDGLLGDVSHGRVEVVQHGGAFGVVLLLLVLLDLLLFLHVLLVRRLLLLLLRYPLMNSLQLLLCLLHRVLLYLLQSLHTVRFFRNTRLHLHQSLSDPASILRRGECRPESPIGLRVRRKECRPSYLLGGIGVV